MSQSGQAGSQTRSELKRVIWKMREMFIAVAVFSFFINFLYLTPSIYMMQIYDRVLGSRSEATLWMLTLIMLALYLVMGVLEWVRSDVLIQAGIKLDQMLYSRVFSAAFEQARKQSGSSGAMAMSDLTMIRQFLTGPGLMAFFDAPWGFLFIYVVFSLHPAMGFMSSFGTILMVILTYVTEKLTDRPLVEAQEAWGRSASFAGNSLRNVEVISSMGMLSGIQRHWYKSYHQMLNLQANASTWAGTINSLSRFVRMALQSLVLGMGAWLTIEAVISPAAMIVASILMGRAMAPIESAIGSWKMFIMARDSYNRLHELLESCPEDAQTMSLPPPKGEVQFEGVVAVPPSGGPPILRNLSFTITAGDVVAVVGPSAAGKSTLARLLVGVWPPFSGSVRLDGANIYAWDKTEVGQFLGYLPQDIELFEGTIADNIARFNEIDAEKVVTAARMAGMHDMILRFPQGYDTPIGVGGGFLSAGQRQRVGLARALYGMPVLIVLDEPNSNLDDVGEVALVEAVRALKAEGRTVILITHRTTILSVVDKIMMLRDGQLAAYGPRDEVLAALRGAPAISASAAQPQLTAA
ncbi:MAG: type I secretion system permease/ATPase [Magnetococcales bacterium]|nr:type I secretion system permease/ATPase [Magnetococcales bacterium]